MIFSEYNLSDFHNAVSDIKFTKDERQAWTEVDNLTQTLNDFLAKKEANNNFTMEQLQDLRFKSILRSIVYIQNEQIKQYEIDFYKSIYEKVNKLAEAIVML